MKQLAFINLEDVSEEDASGYKTREAARAVVFDNDNNVALLHAAKNHYYKLPGGGLEGDEHPILALDRECVEEIGTHVEVTQELGTTLEYREKFNLKQTSFCYIARTVGEKGKPALTEHEIAEGFENVWVPLKDAYQLVSQSKPTMYEGPYMVTRDAIILKTVLEGTALDV